MLGAIIGDLAGSIYEYEQTKKHTPDIEVKNIIEEQAFFSDDTILTIAIADAALNDKDYREKLKEYGKKYINFKPNFSPYFKTIFSPGFNNWIEGDYVGESGGNGAMMRISPIGYYFDTEEKVVENARLATTPSHNCSSAMVAAKKVALAIFYARKGYSKEEIKSKLGIKPRKVKLEKFNYTCEETIDLCFWSLFNSKSFEDAIKLAISFGGDTDTNACIVGSMAEAMYGIDEQLKHAALSKLPAEFVTVIEKFYNKISYKDQNSKI